MSHLLNLLQYAIICFIAYNIFRFLRFIYKNMLRSRMNLKERYGSNSWAIVTGATDGIGRGFVDELALEGFNLILVSRNKEKLSMVSKEIELKHKIKTHTIEFDFAKQSSIEEYKSAFGSLTNSFDISILVNNVGMNKRGFYRDLPLESFRDTINVNIIPQTFLTKIFVDSLTKRSKRSAVIDLSSFSSKEPTIFRAIYTASKSYNYLLSCALAQEYAHDNVDFLCVKPLGVSTPLFNNVKANWKKGIVTAQECASASLNDLVYERVTNGHWVHKIQNFIFECMPFFVRDYIFNGIYLKMFQKNK